MTGRPVITLAVDDVDRARRFYTTALSLTVVKEQPGLVYCALGAAWLALCDRAGLSRYVGREFAAGAGPRTALSLNMADDDAVNDALAAALGAGATLVQPATRLDWGGYGAWFVDPDGHLWELVHNPRPFP